MTRRLRVLASSASLALVASLLASCGGSTGEGAAATNTATQSPAPTVAATAAPQKATFLILQGDTVRSPVGLTNEEKVFLSCVQQSRFPQGSRIVWRFRVIDPLTNAPLDDKALKEFTITLPDGKTQAFKFGGHGGPDKDHPAEYFWTTGFTIPADYPTGLFGYKLTATSLEGAVGTFDQFKVPAAQLTVVAAGQR